MKRKVIFTGGGSAGHVSVNSAVIPEFTEHSWHVVYIGSRNGIEKSIIQKEFPDIPYKQVSVGKLRRYMSLENIKDPFKVIKGIFEARKILKQEKPEFVFSKGGFVSVPVVIAAKSLRIPIIIHESDYTPGLANKIAMPFSSKVLTTFKETAAGMAAGKAMYIGAVLRAGIFEGKRENGTRMCGFNSRKPVMLVMGGSLGAVAINNVVTDNLQKLLKEYNIIHICGKGNVRSELTQNGYFPVEYVHEELFDLLAAADIVVSRAGSNSIFEFLALQKPMLLIPLSAKASRGDQLLNAESFRKQGFCRVIIEEELNFTDFSKEAATLLNHSEDYKKAMAANRPFRKPAEMYELLMNIMAEHKDKG
ncbi:undecaprenyldiphospho-muramoylpentapeptide beta-N-acetylglucosaminyltransferase [Peribacillus sp. SCS-155]|uniref:undecaprenyldiphospho-muramoylpentapeptide beta-N-acetylglucosaminyltransferase n=1 Tax=Peribacillus sedimenti TaxID=3115297 RepID=UPI0039066242